LYKTSFIESYGRHNDNRLIHSGNAGRVGNPDKGMKIYDLSLRSDVFRFGRGTSDIQQLRARA